jgi:gliding motility-associated-like protein
MIRARILPLLFLATALNCFSQGEGKNWYFGQFAGITFTTTSPTSVSGSLVTQEGCSSISDSQGNLLFYTDGVTVYTQSHTVMANGTNLWGSATTAQSGVIVKRPGSATEYFVFTMSAIGSGTFAYSIVDMSLAGGQGSVTAKNVYIHSPFLEKLTAVRHANGTDIWLVVHEYNNPTTNNNYRAYLLTSAGLNTVAVVTAIGGVANVQSVGYLKFSPDGQKMASAFYGSGGTSVELYDFNRTTGVISNVVVLSAAGGGGFYGVEFSPSGSLLYGSKVGTIAQWSVCAGSATAIAASLQTISASANWAMQLASDGKIYVSRYQQATLGVINNPNVAGTGCNYNDLGFSISPAACRLGLPNYVTSWFMPPPSQFTTTIGTGSNGIACMTASFTSPASASLTLQGCGSQTYSLSGLQWNFGDPASGSSNTSTASHPLHQFSGLGTYTVSLVLSYSGGAANDTLRQAVNITQPCISVQSHSITCANLGSATVQAVGGLGPFSYTWMPTNQTSSVASNLSPGTYTITVFDFGNSYSYTAQTVFTSLVPLTGNLSNSSSITCHGASTGSAAITNLAGGSGSQSYLWSNGQSNYTTSTVNTLSAGLWSVTVTDGLTGCKLNHLFLVNQPPARTLAITPSSYSVCLGGTITFTGQAAGGTPGYVYFWTGGPSSNTLSKTEPTGGTYQYTLNATDSYSCPVSKTISVNFVSPPVLSIVHSSICPLETGTVSVSGANNYTWSTNSNNTSISDNPISTTVYTVTGEAQTCTSVATATIFLKPIPNAMWGSNSPRCNGQSLQMFAAGGQTYIWNGPQSFTSASQNPLISAAAINQSGNYSFTVTAANGCTASASGNVTVHPTPTISASGSTVCVNGNLTLFSNSFPGSTFSWTGPVGFASNQQNPTVPNPIVALTGNYNVVATSAAGCTTAAVAHASVVPLPVVSFTTTTPRCFGETLVLNASATTGGAQFSWSGPNGFLSNAITNTISSVSLAAAGVYNLQVTNGPCSASLNNGVVINPLPTPVVSYNGPVCEGKSMTITVTTPANQNIVSYFWQGPGGVSQQQHIPIQNVAGSHSGVYSAMVTDVHGCKASDSKQIDVLFNPTVSAFGTTVCLNQPATLSAKGADNYFWVGPGLSVANGPTVVVGKASSSADVSYFVLGTAVNGCTSVAYASVSTWSLPVPQMIVYPKSAVCLNEPMTLKGRGGTHFFWKLPSGHGGSGEEFSFTPVNHTYNGDYTLQVYDAKGCSNTTVSSITVNPLPSVGLAGNKMEGCAPFCADFSSMSAGSQYYLANWKVDGSNYSGKKFTHCFKYPKKYIVHGSFTDSLTGCAGGSSFTVTAHAQPEAGFSWLPELPVEKFDEVLFVNESTGDDLSSWEWHMQSEIRSIKSSRFSYTFEEPGIYPVALVVADDRGCRDTIVKSIEVLADFHIYVPNAFTPNGDGLNDVFLPVARGSSSYHMQVFNRWGEKVFETSELTKGWDGTYIGVNCPPGTYTWKLSVAKKETKPELRTGSVTMIR